MQVSSPVKVKVELEDTVTGCSYRYEGNKVEDCVKYFQDMFCTNRPYKLLYVHHVAKSELSILLGNYSENVDTLKHTSPDDIFECMLNMRTIDMYSHSFLCELADMFLAGEQKALMKLEFPTQLSVYSWFDIVKKYAPNILPMAALTKEALKLGVVEESAKVLCDRCKQGLNENKKAGLISEKDYLMFYNSCCI